MSEREKYYIEVSKEEHEAYQKNEMFFIEVKEYEALIEDSDLLGALQAAGVDNWSGYEIAFNMLEN